MCWRPGATLDDSLAFDTLGWQFSIQETALHAVFTTPQRIFSSAVFNGGVKTAQHFVNLKVDAECPLKQGGADPISDTFHAHLIPQDINPQHTVGMMTAASMRSTRIVHADVAGAHLVLALTSGLANARRAGDDAEHRDLSDTIAAVTHDETSSISDNIPKVGTINIILGLDRALSDAAMLEAHSLIAEAKCAVLQERGVLSPVSNNIATGTGTDACAVVSPTPKDNSSKPILFCGKHTVLGEQIARAVMTALHDSLDYYSVA